MFKKYNVHVFFDNITNEYVQHFGRLNFTFWATLCRHFLLEEVFQCPPLLVSKMAVCTDDDFIFDLRLDIEVGCTCTLILALLFCRMGHVSLLRSFPKFTKAVARAATDAFRLDLK